MAMLFICYSSDDRCRPPPPEQIEALGLKIALLSIGDDLSNHNIYDVAKQLAELLLEQIE